MYRWCAEPSLLGHEPICLAEWIFFWLGLLLSLAVLGGTISMIFENLNQKHKWISFKWTQQNNPNVRKN